MYKKRIGCLSDTLFLSAPPILLAKPGSALAVWARSCTGKQFGHSDKSITAGEQLRDDLAQRVRGG